MMHDGKCEIATVSVSDPSKITKMLSLSLNVCLNILEEKQIFMSETEMTSVLVTLVQWMAALAYHHFAVEWQRNVKDLVWQFDVLWQVSKECRQAVQ